MFGMRKAKLAVMLLIISIICFGLGTLALFATNGWSFTLGKYTVNINEEKLFDLKDITNITVDVSSADIKVTQEDREDIKVVLSGYINSSSEVMKPELVLDKSTGKLTISIKSQRLYIGLTNMDINLDIFIPKDYSHDLAFDTSSGDITLDKTLTLNNLTCSLSSGDLIIRELTCNTFEYECSSGSLEADILNTKDAAFNSSSGDITISNFTGNITGDSSSGDINVAYKEFDNNVDLHATSGEIKLKLPENAQFYLDAQCSSGDVECKFPITVTEKQKDNSLKGVVKSDKNKVILDTSSGDITLIY